MRGNGAEHEPMRQGLCHCWGDSRRARLPDLCSERDRGGCDGLRGSQVPEALPTPHTCRVQQSPEARSPEGAGMGLWWAARSSTALSGAFPSGQTPC